MLGWQVNNDIESISKEVTVAHLGVSSWHFPVRIEMKHWNLSQDSQRHWRISNQPPPQYKPEILLLAPICSSVSYPTGIGVS
jgi:hypothetical protein